MAGKREQICARLLALGDGLHAWATIGRNIADLSSIESLPAYVVWDGDQNRDEAAAASLNANSRARRLGPKIMEMTPVVVVAVAGAPETIGTTANELHGLVVGTVIHDTTLAGLILHDRLDWLGTMYGKTAEGGETVIEYRIEFVLTYAIHAADLLPEVETA